MSRQSVGGVTAPSAQTECWGHDSTKCPDRVLGVCHHQVPRQSVGGVSAPSAQTECWGHDSTKCPDRVLGACHHQVPRQSVGGEFVHMCMYIYHPCLRSKVGCGVY